MIFTITGIRMILHTEGVPPDGRWDVSTWSESLAHLAAIVFSNLRAGSRSLAYSSTCLV